MNKAAYPKISIVIPTYNSARFIGDALNSVIAQKIDNLETIVVDDGSSDNTREVVKSFGKEIKYLWQENRGAAAARNVGIKAAGGEWIAFLDSDDCWDPNYLNNFSSIVKNSVDIGLFYCGKRWVDIIGNDLPGIAIQKTYPKGWIFGLLFEDNYISSSSCAIVKAEVLNSTGGFNEAAVFRNGEDYDLWLRIAANFEVSALPFPYVHYRRHSDSLTRNKAAYEIGHLAALKNAADLIENGQVNQKNRPDRIDVRARMKKAYVNAVTALFWNSDYEHVRRIGTEALLKGYVSMNLMMRLALSCLPRSKTELLRRGLRSIRNTNAGNHA